MNFKLTRVADGTVFELKQALVAGRLSECDIQLSQGLPSRRHGQVTLVDGLAWAEDLGSANGTWVNGERIVGKVRLKPGDLIRFDVEEFRLGVEGAQAEEDVATLFRASPQGAPVGGRESAKPAEGSGVFKRPGAWADPDSTDGSQKTKFLDPDQLKAMIGNAATPVAVSDASSDGPCLLVLSGDRKGERIRLRVGHGKPTEWNIGSAAGSEIRFSVEGISALHARLVNDDSRWKIIDQMSANGTYVNGKRVTMAYLGGADRIAVGPVECELALPTGQAQRRSAGESGPAASGSGRGMWIIIAVAVLLLGAAAAWWLL